MAEYDGDFVTHIPSVVVTQILSYLSWEDKLNVARVIPHWKACLQSVSAWHIVKYGQEGDENIYFLKEKRTKFLYCIKQYGKHIKSMKLCFGYKIGHMGLQILHAVNKFCSDLRAFHIAQETPLGADGSLVWRKSVVSAICDIIQSSSNLKSVGIKQPLIDWTESEENNIMKNLVQRRLADKITQLELSPESLWEHDGLLDILTNFTRLRSLVVRREIVNNKLILNLVKHGLEELTLYQEEEIPLNQQEDFRRNFWEQVLSICPNFKCDLILRYIVVIKDSFPSKMPLRNLVLDDLVNIVTKGVVDHIAETYKNTLEHFTYTNSLLENFETGDRRLPSALVDMVIKCTKLNTLQYGFPLSSTAILLIAKRRKLRKFSVPVMEVSYEYDWPADAGFSEQEVQYLKDCGSDERRLERAVSELFGFDWKLADQFTLNEMNYLKI